MARTRDDADRAAGWERRAPQGCPGGTTSGRAGGGGTRKLSNAWYRPPNPSATNDLEDELELGVVIAHHSWGAMIEWASHDSRIVPGDVMGSGTVMGGTVSEAICNGLPAP